MDNEKDKITKPIEKILVNKPNLIYKNKGTFGYIFEEGNYIYKISFLSDDESLIKNNILEACFLSGKIHDSEEDDLNSIIQGRVRIKKVKDFFSKFNLGRREKNILKKIFFYEDENLIIIKMKKYSSDLYEDIKNNKYNLNYNNIIKIFKSLSHGLLTLHDNNFLHGDFKTTNILTNDDEIILIDFGGIKLKESPIYNLTCTLTYRCPEDIRKESKNTIIKNFSNKSDIWSLGLVLAEVILGHNIMYKIYIKYRSLDIKEEYIDKKMLNWYNNNKIDIFNEIENKGIIIEENNEKIILLLNEINRMLEIDEKKRSDNLREIYEKITGEKIKKNYEREYNYDYKNITNDYYIGELAEYKDIFFKIRKKCYKWLIELCKNNDNIDSVPLALDIADRYFIKNLKKICESLNIQSNVENKLINYNIFDKMLICFLMLSQCFVYGQVIYYEKIVNLFFIETDETEDVIKHINEIIARILEQLDFDIYRPFYDKNINEKKDIERKEDLYKILINFVEENKIGIKPADYYK